MLDVSQHDYNFAFSYNKRVSVWFFQIDIFQNCQQLCWVIIQIRVLQ